MADGLDTTGSGGTDLLSTQGLMDLESQINLLAATGREEAEKLKKTGTFRFGKKIKKAQSLVKIGAELEGLLQVQATQLEAQEESLATLAGAQTNILGLQESLTLALL